MTKTLLVMTQHNAIQTHRNRSCVKLVNLPLLLLLKTTVPTFSTIEIQWRDPKKNLICNWKLRFVRKNQTRSSAGWKNLRRIQKL